MKAIQQLYQQCKIPKTGRVEDAIRVWVESTRSREEERSEAMRKEADWLDLPL